MSAEHEKACMRCWVKGRVQGVFFRASTKDRARQLALDGVARNLRDGSVEVYACGKRHSLEILRAWLQSGPELANVDRVECEVLPFESLSGFIIR